MDTIKPQISIVIPTFNAAGLIRDCLKSVYKQSLGKNYYEVIVVDSSSDSTPEIIRNEFPEVMLIHLKDKTLPGPARNIGIQNAQAHLIMFIDSDCIADEEILEKMIVRHGKEDCSVIGGSVLNGTPYSISGCVDYLLSFSPFMPSMEEKFVSQLPTCNACYKIDALKRYGVFPSYNFLAEDLILNWRIFKGGERLLFDPSIKIIHINRMGFLNQFKHQWKLGWSYALAIRCTDIPGRVFVDYPILSITFPFLRFGALILRIMKRDKKVLLNILILFPFYLLGATWWAYGFFKGAIMDQEEFQDRLRYN